MAIVFSKCFEVLKPDKYMVLTFNNKDISAWLALLFSIYRSGFTLAENGIYFLRVGDRSRGDFVVKRIVVLTFS